MHDRRIDGVTHTFGNAGALYKNAMTWYDHETRSIWSQPWGRAIIGPLKGVQLYLLPSQLTTWASWKAEYPHTQAMINDVGSYGVRPQGFRSDFVIGLVLGEHAKAYYFSDAQRAGLIHDTLGHVPILLWVSGESFHAYVRQVADATLTFRADGAMLVDNETGSSWDPTRGLAQAGPLQSQALRPVPSLSSYDWAWADFYPDSSFYAP